MEDSLLDESLNAEVTSFPEEDFDIIYFEEICDIYNFLEYKMPYMFENIRLNIFIMFINEYKSFDNKNKKQENNFLAWKTHYKTEIHSIVFHIKNIKNIDESYIVQFLYSYANI